MIIRLRTIDNFIMLPLVAILLGLEGIFDFPNKQILYFLTIPRLVEYIIFPYIIYRLKDIILLKKTIIFILLIFAFGNLSLFNEILMSVVHIDFNLYKDSLGILIEKNVFILNFFLVFFLTLYLLIYNYKYLYIVLLFASITFLIGIAQFFQLDFAWELRESWGDISDKVKPLFDAKVRIFGLNSYIISFVNSLVSMLTVWMFLKVYDKSKSSNTVQLLLLSILIITSIVTLQKSVWLSVVFIIIYFLLNFKKNKLFIAFFTIFIFSIIFYYRDIILFAIDVILNDRVLTLDKSSLYRVYLNSIGFISSLLAWLPFSKDIYLKFISPEISDFLNYNVQIKQWAMEFESHNGFLDFILYYSLWTPLIIIVLYKNYFKYLFKKENIFIFLMFLPNFLTHNMFFFTRSLHSSIILGILVYIVYINKKGVILK